MLGTLTQVAIGGALGAMARFGTQTLSFRLFGPGFPVGTMVVNGLGSFLIGLLAALLIDREIARFSPGIIVGFLGAYTTFSTYALDALRLWERGEVALAASYVLGTVLLSISACVIGMALGRSLFS
ncbi:MAG: fluoride efflux transporter CrcB [Pararhodobacter sp.]|nr:fluoride efflux transporter CrcB [Pararhodobacter sp.]